MIAVARPIAHSHERAGSFHWNWSSLQIILSMVSTCVIIDQALEDSPLSIEASIVKKCGIDDSSTHGL